MNVLASLWLLPLLALGQTPSAELTKEQIIVGLTERRAQLERFKAHYTLTAWNRRGELNRQFEMTFARDGRKRFSDLSFTETQSDPAQRLAGAFDGKIGKRMWYSGRSGEITAGKNSFCDGYDAFCGALHLPVSERSYAEETRPGQNFYLPSAIEQDRYIVRPEQELVEGRWAHVLWVKDPSKLFWAYWVDAERDFCLLKTQQRQGDSVLSTRLYGDHAPAGERFMPRRIQMANGSRESWVPERTAGVTTLVIHGIEVGELPPETFELIFPPTTLVSDEVLSRAYEIPGPFGKDLEELSEEAKQEVVRFQRRMLRPTRWYTSWPALTLVAAVVLAGGLTVTWWFARRQ